MSRTTGSTGTKYKEQFQLFVRYEARGYSSKEIIKELWGHEQGQREFEIDKNRLSRWRSHPDYDKIWMEEIGKFGKKLISKGLRKLSEQVDDEEKWLSNKAANDVVNYAKGRIFGDSDKTVTVKIEGAPDLGTPDQPEE